MTSINSAGVKLQGLNKGTFRFIVKPNSSRTEFLGFDTSVKAFRVAVSAPPDRNRANVALIKFLKKKFDLDAVIVSGFSSRKKTIRLS